MEVRVRIVGCGHLSDVLAAAVDELGERLGLDGDLLLEADGHHGRLDLLHPGPGEPEVKAVVGEAPDLLMVPVIAHRDDGDLAGLDQIDELRHAAPVLVSCHPVHLVHEQHSLKDKTMQ